MGKSTSVIIIEDDEDVSKTFAQIMKSEGISVLAKGSNGQEAIELFKKYGPDLVVLDLMMPDFDGFYAIDGIQKIDPDAKFIVLTADVTEQTRIRLGRLQNISTMYKPYEVTDVINMIKKFGRDSILIKQN